MDMQSKKCKQSVVSKCAAAYICVGVGNTVYTQACSGHMMPARNRQTINTPVSSPRTLGTCTCIYIPISTERLYICENKRGAVSCPRGTLITIVSTYYGRTSRSVCFRGINARYLTRTNCKDRKSLAIVRRSCNGKSACNLSSSNRLYGGDPCKGTYKYLDVAYVCKPGNCVMKQGPAARRESPGGEYWRDDRLYKDELSLQVPILHS
jgi:hypothetical protein